MAVDRVQSKLALYVQPVLNSYLETVLPFQFVECKATLDKTKFQVRGKNGFQIEMSFHSFQSE